MYNDPVRASSTTATQASWETAYIVAGGKTAGRGWRPGKTLVKFTVSGKKHPGRACRAGSLQKCPSWKRSAFWGSWGGCCSCKRAAQAPTCCSCWCRPPRRTCPQQIAKRGYMLLGRARCLVVLCSAMSVWTVTNHCTRSRGDGVASAQRSTSDSTLIVAAMQILESLAASFEELGQRQLPSDDLLHSFAVFANVADTADM